MNANRDTARGYVLGVVCRVVLLLIVVAQVVFLASRYRWRHDLTADKLYTLTTSTETVLRGLEDQLLIECYFTKDDKLPASLQHQRREMKAVFDEYVRRSNGRVALQYFDPQSDTLLKQKAERLQMQAQMIESLEIGELRQQEIWQGLRLRYGGDKQEVIPLLGFQPSTFQYEAILTPRIKDLTVKVKPKVKVAAFPPEGGGRNSPNKGYGQILDLMKSRYDFGPLDLREGKLVPDDTDIVLIIRPRGLNDRHKYALDQYLMRGGKLIVFTDTDDIEIGNQDHRSYWAIPVETDATDAKWKFAEQLAHYGVIVQDKLVADAFAHPVGNVNMGAQEFLGRWQQTAQGMAAMPIFYPYLFHALDVDWGSEQVANQFAARRPEQGGGIDTEKAAQYRAAFRPGMMGEHPLAAQQKIGPGFFWPCPVDLAEPLPSGVTGDVIMRTSPLTLVEKAPRDLNPLGQTPAVPEMIKAAEAFRNSIISRVAAEPRRQVGLVVALTGTFPSFFKDRPLPPRRPPAPDDSDPLVEKVGKEGEAAPPKATDPDEPDAIGPTLPEVAATEDKDKDPDPVFVAPPTAQLVVVGDADFVRDDFLTQSYYSAGKAMTAGPVSDVRATLFFATLLDWLVQDSDLVALRSKVGTDRAIRLGQQDVMGSESAEGFSQRINKKANLLQWINVFGPAALLLVVWLFMSLRRSARKAQFLAEWEATRQ